MNKPSSLNLPQGQIPFMQEMDIPQQIIFPLHIQDRTASTLFIGDLDEQINDEMLYLRLT